LVLFVSTAAFPMVVGGDFNLIRGLGDKSFGNINWPRVRRFDDALASMSLQNSLGWEPDILRLTDNSTQFDVCLIGCLFPPVGKGCFPCALSRRSTTLDQTITRSSFAVERALFAYHQGSSSRPCGLRSIASGSSWLVSCHPTLGKEGLSDAALTSGNRWHDTRANFWRVGVPTLGKKRRLSKPPYSLRLNH
jgi:hypothetical protein